MKPVTVEYLEALKPGEEMAYYCGNFEKDIDRTEHDSTYLIGRQRERVIAYAILLRAVQAAARRLATEGRLILQEAPVFRKTDRGAMRYSHTRYVAVGA